MNLNKKLEGQNEYSYPDMMMIRRFHNQIGKACALAAATLILPVLAHAQTATTTTTRTPSPVAHVPEGGPGPVLLITIGGMLLFSWRQFSRAKKSRSEGS
jgi:hypothetical protein